MKRATWYFDYISPFAYLQWRRLRALGDPIALDPVPILFAAVLDHVGQKGPAEIPGKRTFTYRFVHWQARRQGVPLRAPPAHPFNPMAALRLSIAAGNTPRAIDAIYAHIWERGAKGDDADSLAAVGRELGIADVAAAIADPAVKAQLRSNTDGAIAAGVYGVPTLLIDGQFFWGNDATEMALDYVANPALFDEPEMRRISELPATASRR
ncbi:MAG TPA: 2-hydroxychromene-2-carboxylate isomerase [Xanthomonadales bacterium]|nr:2-hydroxychromene-2-carboxylate isomerase [Xanthomonadales bacterium]